MLHLVFDLVHLKCFPRSCISKNFSGDSSAFDLWTTLKKTNALEYVSKCIYFKPVMHSIFPWLAFYFKEVSKNLFLNVML